MEKFMVRHGRYSTAELLRVTRPLLIVRIILHENMLFNCDLHERTLSLVFCTFVIMSDHSAAIQKS